MERPPKFIGWELLRWWYYPKGSTDSMPPYQNHNDIFFFSEIEKPILKLIWGGGRLGGSVVKHLISAQVMISRFMSSNPTSGKLEPWLGWSWAPFWVKHKPCFGWAPLLSLSLSLSLSLPLAHLCPPALKSIHQSINQTHMQPCIPKTLLKRRKSWRTQISWFQNSLQSYSHQNSMVPR